MEEKERHTCRMKNERCREGERRRRRVVNWGRGGDRERK